jgi:hypothetical protein
MICLANVEKFLDDHLITGKCRDDIMKAAQEAVVEELILSGMIEEIMGTLSLIFFDDLNRDLEHIRIFAEHLRQGDTITKVAFG